ncbi:2Fe-2S iron-sulfur cluster-binding protein [Desmospora profundinema]|uniref:Ferredoxin n=1 Tax=Desmospora profundinema TaxID=1571184 RepID=A0ABU1ILH4_9BACL|nr:2Fe-2S iron-sulfur cluster-binding protein [Desmospora profundinema]MDR6225009.1 ferredoxin [Desmospora profundinema]
MPKVEIIIGKQEHQLEVGEGDNLLFEAVSRSIMIPFNCTSGRCGTCRVRVLEGREHLSEMGDREELRLGDEQVEKGYRLACQAFVFGDVKVEVPQPRLY